MPSSWKVVEVSSSSPMRSEPHEIQKTRPKEIVFLFAASFFLAHDDMNYLDRTKETEESESHETAATKGSAHCRRGGCSVFF